MFLDDLDETFDFIFSGFLVLGSQFYYLFSSLVLLKKGVVVNICIIVDVQRLLALQHLTVSVRSWSTGR